MPSSHFLLPAFYTPCRATAWEVIANLGRNREKYSTISSRAGAAQSTPRFPVLWERTGQTTGHEGVPCPTGSELVGGSPEVVALQEEHPLPEDRGAGLLPTGMSCPAQATALTPTPKSCALCEPNWLVHLKEPAQEPLLRASATAQSQCPKGAAGPQDFWRGQRAGKDNRREPEGFHVSSQSLLGLPWDSKGAQGKTWYINDYRKQEDTETQTSLYSMC